MTIEATAPTTSSAEESCPSISEATLVELVSFAWPLLFDGEASHAPYTRVDGGITASVSIVGTTTATLIVSMDEAMARHTSATLLAMEESELDEETIRDALGETANVVGGNVKGVMEDGSAATLTLPVVSFGGQNVVGGHLAVGASFDAAGGRMTWELYERD